MWVQKGMWHRGSVVDGMTGGGESYGVQDPTVPVFCRPHQGVQLHKPTGHDNYPKGVLSA